MDNALARAKAGMVAIAGKDLTNDQMLTFAKAAYAQAPPVGLEGEPDPDSVKAADLAAHWLRVMRQFNVNLRTAHKANADAEAARKAAIAAVNADDAPTLGTD